MGNGIISTEFLVLIIVSTLLGTVSRALTIKVDYRQYPSFPNGYIIHLVTGAIAASLGAFIIPAVMTKNFVAVTFLTLAIQQFRDVRRAERESLKSLENTEYTYRGDAYIDGIAKTYESRNYFALIVAFSAALTMQLLNEKLWIEIIVTIFVSFLIFKALTHFLKGKKVSDIADIKEGKIEFKDHELYVDGIFVTNLLGTENIKKMFKEEGLAVVIYPRENHFRITLDNFGQRQAILFEATRALGVKRYGFTRKDYQEGKIVIALIPIEKNIELFKETVANTPLIESVKKSHAVMDKNQLGGD